MRAYDYYGASGVIDNVDEYIFDDELILIAEDGANLVLRNLPLAIIARGKFWVNNHAHILKPKRGSIVFLAYVLETLNYKPWISGAAQPKLTQDRLMSISISVAPPDEQVAIVDSVYVQTRPLQTAISRLEREIDLLREYRTRLVADVVTGKLDVREAAATLPDEDPLGAFAASRDPDPDLETPDDEEDP
jgi:type I restriction enzyme S subunit